MSSLTDRRRRGIRLKKSTLDLDFTNIIHRHASYCEKKNYIIDVYIYRKRERESYIHNIFSFRFDREVTNSSEILGKEEGNVGSDSSHEDVARIRQSW